MGLLPVGWGLCCPAVGSGVCREHWALRGTVGLGQMAWFSCSYGWKRLERASCRDVSWGGWQRCLVPRCCSGDVLPSRERAGAFLPLLPSSFPAALPVGVGLLAGG